nr:translation initiation factor IF-2-like [Symphalangus syndactylus]
MRYIGKNLSRKIEKENFYKGVPGKSVLPEAFGFLIHDKRGLDQMGIRGLRGCPRAAHPSHGPLEPPPKFPPRTRPTNPAQGEGWSRVFWLPHQRKVSGPLLEPSPGPRPSYHHCPYLLLGEVLGHSALRVQPQQAADGDADQLLELPALLQRPAGRGPCASLHGLITPATALLLSHRGGAQRCSMHTAAAEAESPGRGRLSKEPPRGKRWTRSAPRRCSSQDAGRAGSPVCRSSPQRRGGGNNKPRLQKAATVGAKSHGGKKPRHGGKKLRRRGTKAAVAGAQSRGGGGKKPRQEKPRRWGGEAAAVGGRSRSGGGKKPRRRGKKSYRPGQKAAATGGKSCKKIRRQGQKAAVAGAKSH